ncbi:MAG: energy transducer TonB [Burkholderiales bacterium]
MNNWTRNSPVTKRLVVALGASLCAHLALLLLPYAGGADSEAGAMKASRGMQYRIMATHASEAPALVEAGVTKAVQAETSSETSSKTSGKTSGAAPAAVLLPERGMLPIAAPAFYSSDQLSKRPMLLGDDPLDATPPLVLASSGKLMLKLWINDQGQVVQAETEKSNLPQEFALAAAQAFKQARFAPGERGGLPVGSIIRIEVSYQDSRKSS